MELKVKLKIRRVAGRNSRECWAIVNDVRQCH
jgi:hypothetical protein